MARAVTVLRGERVVLRPATAADVPALAAVLRAPAVARWWGDRVEGEILEALEDADTTVWVVCEGDEAIGMVQAWEEPDPMYRHAGIDVALHPDRHGRGLGTDTIRTVARWLLDACGHHRLTIDPAAENTVAIRCYERVGFRRVGVMRQYERGPDGTWHDGLLMELLRGELR
jgi:aminoglycoside 6'-N-acetyltransferase